MPSIVKLVCDSCGKVLEYEKVHPNGEPDDWKNCAWLFCPDCWKVHLEIVRGYIEDFGKRFTMPKEYEKNQLMVGSMILLEAINDLRMARNNWNTSLPRREEQGPPYKAQ